MYEKLSLRYAKLARRYIGVKLSTGAIRHSKTRLAQTAGRGGARAAKLIMYTFSPEKVQVTLIIDETTFNTPFV